LIKILIIIGLIYLGFCLFFYFFQDFFFFRPEKLPSGFQYKYPFPFEEVNFDMEDGGKINGIYFKVPNPRGVVYYLKGNSRSIKGWGKFARDFVSNGYDFFMMDYRGFGKSQGKRTQTLLFSDAQYIYKWLAQKYPENKIVIFGRSLGSGIAARIASWNNVKMLILDSPYYSFYHNLKRFLFMMPLKRLLRYDIRTDQYLKNISCPVYIIHGDKDHLFPINQSERLKALYPQIQLFKISGGHHNDLPEFPEFFEILYDILYVEPEEET
jgi:pimeloyl-ACP methyl ester carboxylesterase